MAKKFTEEEIKDLKAKFKTISEDNLFGEMDPVQNMYVDLSIMIDYELSALLLLYNDEKDYEYIVKQVKDVYNKSLDPTIITSFPRLAITYQDIKDVFNNPYYNKVLSLQSPATNVREFIMTFIQQTAVNGEKFRKDKNDKLSIVFNNPFFELNAESKASILYELKNINADIKFIHDPTYEDDSILQSEYLFFNNMLTFNKSLMTKKMFDVQEFIEKTIIIPYKSETVGFTMDDKEVITKLDELAEKIIGKFVDFSFVHRFVLCE